MSFENRKRMSFNEAVEAFEKPTNTISHLTYNDDGTFSIVDHINCEYCRFCEAENFPENASADTFTVHRARPDIYDNEGY